MTLNPVSAERDAWILRLASVLYGDSPRIEKCASEVNYCARLRFANGKADRVIKLANRDPEAIEVERLLYPEMRSARLPVPSIEYSHSDWPEETPPFIIMPSFSDETVSEACLRLDDQADHALRQSGSFIAEVDRQFAIRFEAIRSLAPISGRLAATQESIDRSLDLDLVRSHEPELTKMVEERLTSSPPTDDARLTHGQPHTKNILSDAQGRICVVDFGETIGYRSPLADLFLLLTSHDGWSRGSGNPSQRQSILQGYGPLEDKDWSELGYWELRHLILALQFYLGLSGDPSNDAQFVYNQLRFIRSQIVEVTSGKGFISRIQSELAA